MEGAESALGRGFSPDLPPLTLHTPDQEIRNAGLEERCDLAELSCPSALTLTTGIVVLRAASHIVSSSIHGACLQGGAVDGMWPPSPHVEDPPQCDGIWRWALGGA